VPNYVVIITPIVDKLARWAKEQLTVHQIHISACRPSVYFPFGYFLRYRDYCSDMLVELKSVDKRSAVTPVGHVTGIEPVTDGNTYENRPVCGIFNIKRLMFTHRERGIRPIDFLADDIASLLTIEKCIVGCKLFPSESPERNSWVSWFKSVLPIGGSLFGEEYILTHEYKQPLKDYLSGKLICHLSADEIDNLEEARTKSTPVGSNFRQTLYNMPRLMLT
jgi:hypothetical protein